MKHVSFPVILAVLLAEAPGVHSQVSSSASIESGGVVSNPITVTVGNDSPLGPLGWIEGVCYSPVTEGVSPGDKVLFEFAAHNVYLMASEEHYHSCDFADATLLAQVGDESPYSYTIPPEAEGTMLYFACMVGDHCAGGSQKLTVGVSAFWGHDEFERQVPDSTVLLGMSSGECDEVQRGAGGGTSEAEQIEASGLRSSCSDPVLVEDGEPYTYYRTCLSGPATLTPGGVVNRLSVMHDPFPQDHRVLIGQRTFEFVQGDPEGEGGEGVTPVPVNQLYVHHLSGSVVFGQGSEGIRQTAPDAPFPEPYSLFSGDDGNSMIFHLIDLREVDEWLACVECRCPLEMSQPGTYLDDLQRGNITGGVNCCSNCTALEGPTVDYRMRYNITYRELQPDDAPVTDVRMLTADISPMADSVLEHDVPSWEFLPPSHVSPENPRVQRLEVIKPFKEIFKDDFFQGPYKGPQTVQLLRCVAHLHIAAIEMWLEDYATGERLCDGQTTYGTDPITDEGFLTAVSVTNFDPPREFPADLMVRFVTDYNATIVHTGVMGYWFLFTAGDEQVTAKETSLTVDLCLQSSCDASLLPQMDMAPFVVEMEKQKRQLEIECVDTITESPSCTFGGICDCEAFVNAPESSGGCNGFYSSAFGDIEIRSLCANYCGCDISAAVDQAAHTADAAAAAADENCVDSLADHPSCTMAGLCDCETFVNLPESTGCGGVYTSPFGNVEIDSVCNKYCGCNEIDEMMEEKPSDPQASPAEPQSSLGGLGVCRDALENHPACRFGGVCTCEEFVNAEESEGCGGLSKSEMGDTVVNDVCALYCNACVEKSVEELFEEAYSEVVTLAMRDNCHYATSECEAMLSNLYSCGSEMAGIDEANQFVKSFVVNHGQEAAQMSAKLGSPSLHVGSEDQTVEFCIADQDDNQMNDVGNTEQGENQMNDVGNTEQGGKQSDGNEGVYAANASTSYGSGIACGLVVVFFLFSFCM